jgi:membrane associated rhomboid family serine protease
MESRWQEPTQSTPPMSLALPPLVGVTRQLLFANIALFLVTFFLSLFPATEGAWTWITQHLALDPRAWMDSFPLVPVWQVVTYGFLHSVTDIGHILGNMLMLYFFGTMLEQTLGSRKFLIAYLSAQLVGALFFFASASLSSSHAIALGASGAVYGVMIAVATMRPKQLVFLLFIPVTMKVLALIILALTLFGALRSFKDGDDGIAHMVHLGGIAYGFLAVRSRFIYKDPVETVRVQRALAEVERAGADEERVDRLLEKIHREGMGSLSKSDREFLKRVASRK